MLHLYIYLLSPFWTLQLTFLSTFTVKPGKNTIPRASTDSSVTIPFERIFRDHGEQSGSTDTPTINFCDCGWPQYLLVPKGNTDGYPVKFFVMISNWSEDKVNLKYIIKYLFVVNESLPDKLWKVLRMHDRRNMYEIITLRLEWSVA